MRVQVSSCGRRAWRVSSALVTMPMPQVPLSAGSTSRLIGVVVLERGAEGGRDRAVARAEVPPVVAEPAVLDLLDGRRGAHGRQPAGQRGAPAAGVDHQVGVQQAAVLGLDPRDVGDPGQAGRSATSRPFTATPRQTSTPGVAAASRAITASMTGRRAVTRVKRSSPGRKPPETCSGTLATKLKPRAPAASSAGRSSGSSASMVWRQRGRNMWSRRNWLTPRRSHSVQQAAGSSGGGAGSRSRSRTRCPSRPSRVAVVSPPMPPPTTITSTGSTSRSYTYMLHV